MSYLNKKKNKRLNPRLLFSAKDRICTTVMTDTGPSFSFSATLLNISAGGMGLAVQKDLSLPIKVDQTLVLKSVQGHPDWHFLAGMTLQIKWLMRHDFLQHAAFGCRFVKLSRNLQEKIEQRIDDYLIRYRNTKA